MSHFDQDDRYFADYFVNYGVIPTDDELPYEASEDSAMGEYVHPMDDMENFNKKQIEKSMKIDESKLRAIIAESIKRVLKEDVGGAMTPQEFHAQLEQAFYRDLRDIFMEVIKNFGYDEEFLSDEAADYAAELAYQWADKSIELLEGSNWDFPQHNLRSLDYVMEEQGIHNFQELLAKPNAVEIYTGWYWQCFGTRSVSYNFGEYINAIMDEQ